MPDTQPLNSLDAHGAARGDTRYYVSLDGLRAVAVLMVFCQHYGGGRARIFGWGWAGVDVFFVLSGFLITGILFDSQDQPHRFRDFYIRRTLRIFPLYYAIWLVILLLAPVAQWQWNLRWALWPAYVGNYARFFFLNVPGDPYRFDRLTFGAVVQGWFGSPMHLYIGHFWSLCVEEQFYLLWPFIVYKVRRRETLMKICLSVVILSPLLRWLLSMTVPSRMLRMELLYRSLPTRLDALLLGGLLALCLRGRQRDWLHRWGRFMLLGATALLAVLYMTAVNVMRLPLEGSASIYVFTLIDFFAAALILESIHSGSILGRVLSMRPLRSLGVISYGFYVYHDLLHDFYSYFGRRFFPAHAFVATTLSAFVCSVAISVVSYRFLERPLLKLKGRFTHQVHEAPSI
jgi:peptidoglycan/LPS O-acetylase OafA/YrhL